MSKSKEELEQGGYSQRFLECKSAPKLGVCKVLHEGWEMDNLAWYVQLSNGEKQVMTTNHGRECFMHIKDLLDKIDETRQSLDGLLKLLSIVNEKQ